MKITGRRVRIILEEGSLRTLGKIGVVKKDDGPNLILVQIKNWDQGHSGLDADSSSNRWWFTRKALKLLPRRKRIRK